MDRFQHCVVYPVGLYRADPAVETAFQLARHTGAKLEITSVLSPDGQHTAIRMRKRRAQLHALTAQLGREGIRATSRLLLAKSPAKAIVELVRGSEADLVVKTARPGSGPEARAFSSTAKELFRTCPCAVWTVGDPVGSATRTLLAAVAPYHDDPESEKLDRDVLEVAVQLAALRDAELHVVSVWKPIGAAVILRNGGRTEYNEYVRESEIDARRSLRAFLSPFDIPYQNVHMRTGQPGETIGAVASQLDAELVVVGSAGRTGIKRWLLGNTVESVLDAGPGAVLGVPLSA